MEKNKTGKYLKYVIGKIILVMSRYSFSITGKWYKGKIHLGKIYEWVWAKKREKRKRDLVIDKFNKTELRELKAEGFPIE